MVSHGSHLQTMKTGKAEGLGEVPRSQHDLVAALLELPDDRGEEEHVRRIGKVDPDPHGSRPQ